MYRGQPVTRKQVRVASGNPKLKTPNPKIERPEPSPLDLFLIESGFKM